MFGAEHLLGSSGWTRVGYDLWIATKGNPQPIITKGGFDVSELTGQTIPVVIRISLLIKTIRPDQSSLNSMHEGDGFSAKTLWKKPISFAYWSGNGLAGQF